MFDPRISTDIGGEMEAAVNGWRLWRKIHASCSLANEADRSSALNLFLRRAGSRFVGTRSAVLERAGEMQAATLLLHQIGTRLTPAARCFAFSCFGMPMVTPFHGTLPV